MLKPTYLANAIENNEARTCCALVNGSNKDLLELLLVQLDSAVVYCLLLGHRLHVGSPCGS
jgi:hypothetical protein